MNIRWCNLVYLYYIWGRESQKNIASVEFNTLYYGNDHFRCWMEKGAISYEAHSLDIDSVTIWSWTKIFSELRFSWQILKKFTYVCLNFSNNHEFFQNFSTKAEIRKNLCSTFNSRSINVQRVYMVHSRTCYSYGRKSTALYSFFFIIYFFFSLTRSTRAISGSRGLGSNFN